MIQIREATVADIDLIAKIGTETFLETYLVNTPKSDVETFIRKAFDKIPWQKNCTIQIFTFISYILKINWRAILKFY